MMQSFLLLQKSLHLGMIQFQLLVSADVEDARPAQLPSKGKPSSISKPVKPIANGNEGKNGVPMNRPMQTKMGKRPEPTSADQRKSLGRNDMNWPSRPVGSKGPHPKASATTIEKKKTPAVSTKSPGSVATNAPLSKPQATLQKRHLEHVKEHQRLDRPKMVSKQPLDKPKVMPKKMVAPSKPKVMPKQMVPSSKTQMKPPKQVSPIVTRIDRPKKRPVRQYSDEEDMDDDGEEAIRMIRSMFGYNPKKYADIDDDVSDMEANFDDILEEEKLSSKIAREEDERELALIEEEERRERMRKKGKKRKLMSKKH